MTASPNAASTPPRTREAPPPPARQGSVQRQVRLPLSKAVEIAYKSIRMRLSRSLLVTSGIVLALAFLMSILCNDALTDAMRAWAESFRADSPYFQKLRERRQAIQDEVRALDVQIDDAVEGAAPPAADQKKFDPKSAFGATFAELQEELHHLPAQEEQLINLLTANSSMVTTIRKWIDLTRESEAIRAELTAPERLKSMMAANGVPTTPQEIAGSRLQTRWLLGLALLVAFVGILNAMLMSVTERFREIGTMKCLGALDSFIIKLFLIESLFQGTVGTLLGVIVGLCLSLAAASANYGAFAWKNVPYGSIFASVGVCVLVGIGLTVAAAVYPAWQAARMQPIEAMRVET